MIKKIVNSTLELLNLHLVKVSSDSNRGNRFDYISAQETIEAAQKAGLSICDYVEKLWNQVGETQNVIDNMQKLGVFEQEEPAICEIGAGTGRYMEKIIKICSPSHYESYESAHDWADWLQKQFPIISQSADGFSLKSTRDNSIDLIHSHGVFVYLKFLDTIRYFIDMTKKIKSNGFIVFDCYTEDCLLGEILDNWLNSNHNYPSILPNEYIVQFFEKNRCKLLGNFFNPHGQGKSKYFVFQKK